MIKIVDIRGCGFVPSNIVILQTTWSKYREKLENILVKHRKIFPSFKKGTINFDDFGIQMKDTTTVDAWGCVWKFNFSGLDGQVIKHPLEDWNNLNNLKVPDPEKGIAGAYGKPTSWEVIESSVKLAKEKKELSVVSFPHGFFFMRLHYLRGFTNLMKDFVLEPTGLEKLIEIVTNYNLALVERIAKLNVDIVTFGDDLGLQDRMPISEKTFRKFIFPSYKKIFQKVRSSGARVYLHSDGHIMEVVDDLIEAGVSVINLQDRVNGIENIEKKIKGRVCIDLDIDRQYIVPFGTPEIIKEHIKNAVTSLGSKNGGLMLYSEIHADVPLRNIDAVCNAMEEFMDYYDNC
ncbi:MAG: uroporphyrinogen decarboxylase family protein [Thermoproteota archaeon]